MLGEQICQGRPRTGWHAATWKGAGVEVRGSRRGELSGAVYYSSTSPKFARLNTVAQPFEFEVDAEGSTHPRLGVE
jgi:hypothetical protein